MPFSTSARTLGGRQEAGQVDPAGDAAVLRRDPRDALGLQTFAKISPFTLSSR